MNIKVLGSGVSCALLSILFFVLTKFLCQAFPTTPAPGQSSSNQTRCRLGMGVTGGFLLLIGLVIIAAGVAMGSPHAATTFSSNMLA